MKEMRLFLVACALFAFASLAFGQAAIINEWSQGSVSGQTMEWVEILVVEDNLDLQGWRLNDNTTASYLRFAALPAWESVAAGTIIVIYNGATGQRDAEVPADDYDFSDYSVVISSSNTTYFSYVGGTSWSACCAFNNNTNSDFPFLYNYVPELVHRWNTVALDFTSANVYPTAGGTGGTLGGTMYTGNGVAGVTSVSNWSRFSGDLSACGLPNGGDNSVWIDALRSSHYNGGGWSSNPNSSNTAEWIPTIPNDAGTANQPTVGITFPAQGGANTNPSSVTVSYSATIPPAVPLTDPINRYWTITPSDENFTGAELTFNFTASELPGGFNLSGIVITYSIDGGNNWIPLPGTYTAVDHGTYYSVTVTGLNHFSLWSLGNDALLPVELTSFTGVPTANGIELRWRTESETENDYFAIDRWIEGNESEVQSFTVRSLSQNGSSSIPLDYIYRDTRNLVPGAVYNYRMSDVNQSGERRLLRVITVHNTVSEVTVPRGFGLVETYPNPFNSMATIKVQLRETGNAKVAVYNLEGKLVKELYSGSLGIQPRLITWDASQMATGMYVVKLTSNRFSTEKKLVLMR